MTFDPGNLLIVGAGFSFNAGLPLAGNFTEELLGLRRVVQDGPSARQIEFIKRFADRVFGEGAPRTADDWPDLEDIFTLVDLSANTGHHLGPHYSAADLRIVRRAIIVRMIRMLSHPTWTPRFKIGIIISLIRGCKKSFPQHLLRAGVRLLEGLDQVGNVFQAVGIALPKNLDEQPA